MNVSTYTCSSCAISSITDLGTQPNALEAMKTFCSRELGAASKFSTSFLKLTPYYIYCAGPEVPASDPHGSHHSKAWVKYGTEFTEFILANKLGTIATLGQKYNLKHHPNTTAQLWMWSPDQEAMEAWWIKINEPKVVVKPPEV